MQREVIFIPKSILFKKNWKILLQMISIDQASCLLERSGIPAQDCDSWLFEIAKTLKKGIEIEDEEIRFL